MHIRIKFPGALYHMTSRGDTVRRSYVLPLLERGWKNRPINAHATAEYGIALLLPYSVHQVYPKIFEILDADVPVVAYIDGPISEGFYRVRDEFGISR